MKRILAPRGPKGICFDDFFYGIETGRPDAISQYVETYLQRFENEIAGRMDAVISTLMSGGHVLQEEKRTLAELMSMLWIRVPAMRAQINRMSEQVLNGPAPKTL